MSLEALKPQTDIRYRADVDGLRAVAILSVLLFHAFPEHIPGGFTGVDIFFVISGFLITQIIIAAVDRGTFSFRTFYYRRARRLLPSLALVLGGVVIASSFILFGSEIEQLGRHIISGLFFTLNFALAKEAGYFDTDAAAKPLLHLWSLGVEEQFYLFWPLLIFALRGSRRVLAPALVPVLAVLGLVSFALNIAFVRAHPVGTFYLPHGRFWEMICGALITFISPRACAAIHDSRWMRSALSGAGLLSIAAGLALCRADGYPGWQSLMPSLGTTAIILAGPRAWLNRFVLSSAICVFIGYLSYPLYLWHWPILAFVHVASFGLASAFVRVGALGLAFVLAAATFYFLELPIRAGRRTLSITQLATIAAIVALTGAVLKKSGRVINPLPATLAQHVFLTDETVKSSCYIDRAKYSGHDAEFCQSDSREMPTLAVWGDSKADAIYAGLVPESRAGERWLLMGRAGCAPAKGLKREFYFDDPGEGCLRSNRVMLETLLAHPEIKTVLIATADRVLHGVRYHDMNGREADGGDGVIEAIKALLAAGKRVLFLVDNPTLADPERCVQRPIFHERDPRAECEISVATFRARTSKMTALVDRLHRAVPGVTIVDATDDLCVGGRCSVEENGNFLYGKTDHLSDFGARKVARRVLEALGRSR